MNRGTRVNAVRAALWSVVVVASLWLAGCCGEEEPEVDAASRYASASVVCPNLAVVQRDFGATLGGTYGGASFLEYEIKANAQGEPVVIPPNGSPCAQEIANRVLAACRVCEQTGGGACLGLVGGFFSTPSVTCTFCGDAVCSEGAESLASCPADCTCGNGLCEGVGAVPENPLSCPQDCGGTCGDRYCAEPLEACSCEGSEVEGCLECVQDCCVAVCGDGTCDLGRGEAEQDTASYCEVDCGGGACGDAVCQPTENSGTCPADCALLIACGDGICAAPETCLNCPEDCGLRAPGRPATCFDNICHTCELRTCELDCEGVTHACGDGVCGAGEHPANCPEDCLWRDCPNGVCGSCGNGVCEPGETVQSCVADCDAACPGTSWNAGGDVPVCVVDEHYCGRATVNGNYSDVIYDCGASSASCPSRPGIEGCFNGRCDYEDGTLEPFCNAACPNRQGRYLDVYTLCPPNFEPYCLGAQALTTCMDDPTYASGCPLLRVVACPAGCLDGECAGAPVVVGLSPQPVRADDTMVVSGTNFGAAEGTVTFPSDVVATITRWTNQSITVPVPASATSGELIVARADGLSAAFTFVLAEGPTVYAVVPGGGSVGDTITIRGAYFGASAGTVTFVGQAAQASVVSWSDAEVRVVVPAGATTGPIAVTLPTMEEAVSGAFFVDTLPIFVADFSPKVGRPGDTVTLTGRNFPAGVEVYFGSGNGTPAAVVSRAFDQVVVTVPEGIDETPIRVRGPASDQRTVDTFYLRPVVTAVTSCGASEAMIGDLVTIEGSAMREATFVFAGGSVGRRYTNNGSFAQVYVPAGAMSGPVRVVREGIGEADSPPLTILPGGDTTAARWPMPDSMTARCVADGQVADCGSLAGTVWDGQDGQRTAPAASFTAAGAGLVTDNVTGLTWRAQTATSGWEEAMCGCRGLSAGGQGEWRLPSVIELVSILDFGGRRFQGVSSPYMGDDVTMLWARDAFAPDTNRVWTVTSEGPLSSERLGELHPVYFCVRGGAEPVGSRYEVTEGIVTDRYTGLRWERRRLVNPMAWTQAMAHCAALDVEGQSAWRLPSVKELLTIVDRSQHQSAVDPTAFPAETFPRGDHWTSTPWGGGAAQSFIVDFEQGVVRPSTGQAARGLVMCVSD